ncbi:hypothetical protein Tco_0190905 [Tanacetum coccineum]
MVPPSTLNVSPPLSPITSPGISPSKLLTTPKLTPPPLTSPPSAPTQPSKHSSPLVINLDPVELIFSTPPTSPHSFFDSLEDLPPRTPILLHLDLRSNLSNVWPINHRLFRPWNHLSYHCYHNFFLRLTHEMFCEHCQRTQVIVDDLHEEMRFILNHILDHFNILAHNNNY